MHIITIFIVLQTELFEPENILKFADYLYTQEEHVAALNEYRRYMFLTDSIRKDIPEKIIECLLQLKKYDEAIIETVRLNNRLKRDFTKGWIYFLAGEYESSRNHLHQIKGHYLKDAEKIIGLGYAYEYRFQEAGEYIELPDKKPSYKKPLLGVICGVLPGGGHLYSGRIGDGIFSFLVVGTTGLISYYYHNRDEDLKFGISLGAAILFYTGSIYGGINAVRNYNYFQNEDYLQKILESAK